MCGENWREMAENIAESGSSPRVRGKPQPQSLTRIRIRLIPACAGKT